MLKSSSLTSRQLSQVLIEAAKLFAFLHPDLPKVLSVECHFSVKYWLKSLLKDSDSGLKKTYSGDYCDFRDW